MATNEDLIKRFDVLEKNMTDRFDLNFLKAFPMILYLFRLYLDGTGALTGPGPRRPQDRTTYQVSGTGVAWR